MERIRLLSGLITFFNFDHDRYWFSYFWISSTGLKVFSSAGPGVRWTEF